MCDFKPGDEVVCVAGGAKAFPGLGWVCLAEGATYTIAEYQAPGEIGETGLRIAEGGMVQLVELGHLRSGDHCGFRASRFRKVQKRNDRLTLESFLTIKPRQFEEPRRVVPSKTREKA